MRDYLDITPLDIQQHQFHIRFRGFDIQEVDGFLDQTARTIDKLYGEIDRLKEENNSLKDANQILIQQEEAARQQATQTQQLIDQVNTGARKSAEAIMAEAELKGEKIINQAYNRLAQVHEDIIRLKTQRMQIEAQIRALIDSHIKLLDMEKQQMLAVDQEYDRIRKVYVTGGQPSFEKTDAVNPRSGDDQLALDDSSLP
ncbi:MAG: DivIVA domain-containing protein [Desulfatirhabdiaceae bacterium]